MFPVETFQRTLTKLVAILERQSIRFHLTGGVTSASYGEPRMTQDIDLVIDPTRTKAKLEQLIQELLKSDFLFSEDAIRQAVAGGGMFQLLDTIESLKLDVYPRELIEGELDRSVEREVFEGVFLPIVSLVDAAVSKLIWIFKGSHKSRRDVRGLFRSASDQEKEDVRQLAQQLQLESLLDEVLSEKNEL